jgi:hypothetical protein
MPWSSRALSLDVLDDVDRFVDPAAVPAGELDELARLSDDGAVVSRSRE